MKFKLREVEMPTLNQYKNELKDKMQSKVQNIVEFAQMTSYSDVEDT